MDPIPNWTVTLRETSPPEREEQRTVYARTSGGAVRTAFPAIEDLDILDDDKDEQGRPCATFTGTLDGRDVQVDAVGPKPGPEALARFFRFGGGR